MYKQAEKNQDNKYKIIGNSIAQKKGNGKYSMAIVDNRAGAAMHTNGCGCSSCAGAAQLKAKVANQTTSIVNSSGSSTEVTQLCQHNHPEHAGVLECPYGLSDPSFRAPEKHIKGYTGKIRKRNRGRAGIPPTVASESVMSHAEEQLSAGSAQVISHNANGGNDIEVAVKRKHRHKKTSPQTRTFFIHKGSNPVDGGGNAHDFFMKAGEPSDSDSSGSESDVEEKKSDE
ncbi:MULTISPECIES: hypothetical protein [unclassified Enterobacter]|uniref:hypothetical protein n=1 Tax=unclassified Enterobacter TaxID=2608935 RepID=UPI0003ED1631|nr:MULTISPECIES: hypothetical protein [unclassified Enterobacter]EWG68601.1 hypothetical protein P348_02555 [Enterobacter sp. DC3]EWG77742.1 hypothetical protein P349_00542 [Enterobacter sp. DC4]